MSFQISGQRQCLLPPEVGTAHVDWSPVSQCSSSYTGSSQTYAHLRHRAARQTGTACHQRSQGNPARCLRTRPSWLSHCHGRSWRTKAKMASMHADTAVVSNFVPSSVTRKRSCVLPSCCGAWHAALQSLDVGDDGDDDDCMDEGLETKDLERVWEGVENAGSSHQVDGTKNHRRPAGRHRFQRSRRQANTVGRLDPHSHGMVGPSTSGSQVHHKQTSCSLRKLTNPRIPSLPRSLGCGRRDGAPPSCLPSVAGMENGTNRQRAALAARA